jgi:hypothetical protein
MNAPAGKPQADRVASFRRRCAAATRDRLAGKLDLHDAVDGLAAWAAERGIDIDVAQRLNGGCVQAAPAPRRWRAPMSKLTVVVEGFRPLRSNTLFGFVTITIPEMHLRIADLTVHEPHGKRWVGLPGKPQIDRDGTVRENERGKPLYVPILQFTDKATLDAFGARVVAALLEFAPAAFEEETA